MANLTSLNLNGVVHTLGGGVNVIKSDGKFVITDGASYGAIPYANGTPYKRGRALTTSDFSIRQLGRGIQLRGPGLVTDCDVSYRYSYQEDDHYLSWDSPSSPFAFDTSSWFYALSDADISSVFIESVSGYLAVPL